MVNRFIFLFIKILFVILSTTIYAQQIPADIATFFKLEREKQDSIYEAKFSTLKQARSSNKIMFEKSKLVKLTDIYALFLETGDIRANKAINIDFLQNGTIGTEPILGDNIEITVFDGGKVYSQHKDFMLNGQTKVLDLESNSSAANHPISSHTTAVSGLIAANGTDNLLINNVAVYNATRGVLPNAVIKTAGFRTTEEGSVFEKILKYNPPISNHSYGSNFGWAIASQDNVNKTAVLYYPVKTNVFFNDEETFAGIYMQTDADYDLIVHQNPQNVIVKSAGNYYGIGPANYDASWQVILLQYDGNGYVPLTENDIIPKNNSFDGAYSITTGSLGKNIITVGAIDLPIDEDYKLNKNNIVRSEYSSVGPRKDGAIKPDLVTVGTNVVFPGVTVGSYALGSGTSYAAPKTTGVIGALTQIQRLLTKDSYFLFTADKIKTLLIHTTKEAGLFPGPDNKYGWGALDAKKAAETLLAVANNEAFFYYEEKTNGTDFEKIISSRANDTIKVTLSWIDLPFTNFPTTDRALLNDRSSRLVHDLDIRLIDLENNATHYPWMLNRNDVTGPAIKGDNTVDNVEQIVFPTSEANRNYKVVVSNKSNLIASQFFSLLITGADEKDINTPEVPPKENLNEFKVFPTITTGIVNIKGPEKINVVTVFDMTGKLVYRSEKSNVLNVSNLSKGLYLVKISTESGKSIIKKIIRN